MCGLDFLDEVETDPKVKKAKRDVHADGIAAPSDGVSGSGGSGGSGGGPRLTPGRGLGERVDFGDNIGYIRFYPFTNRFEALCLRDGHTVIRCRLTKYASESRGVGDQFNPAAGRPLGLMAAWLLADFAGLPHEHHNPFFLLSLSRQDRQDGRAYLDLLPGGKDILHFERPQRTGEPAEPIADP